MPAVKVLGPIIDGLDRGMSADHFRLLRYLIEEKHDPAEEAWAEAFMEADQRRYDEFEARGEEQ
jgi:hypothetical protein